MKYRLALLAVLSIQSCYSQNVFSLGARGGLGGTIFPAHPEFQSNNTVYPVQTNPYFATGLSGQYLINNLAGFESGLHVMYHSYSARNGDPYLKNYLSNDATIEVIDYQIPIVLMYNIHHPFNAARQYKIAAGTSVDWLTTSVVTKLSALRSLKNFIVSIRIVRDNLKYGRLEYSLEHQYSLSRFVLKGVDYDQLNDRINTRTSTLTFNVYYFFWIKQRK